jgi:P4 family phage/plasmid primase-like protien
LAVALHHCRQRLNITVDLDPAHRGKTLDQRKMISDARWKKEWVDKGPAAYASGLRKNAGGNALVSRLADECGTSPEAMTDRHPRHLNVANGVLDLHTGQLHPHHPGWMMTYCLEASWNPEADCPRYCHLLWRAAGEREDIYWTLVDALGYSIGGHNDLQKIFFLNGPAASGKSKLLQVLSTVMKPLSHQGDSAMIERNRNGRNAREETALIGMRVIAVSETSARIHIEEAWLKRLTGQDEVSLNKHYETDKITTMVTWVIIFATNEMPSVIKVDSGLRRRIIVIPMGPPIPEHLWNDQIAAEILATELDGILTLLVAGYQRTMMGHRFRADLLPQAVQEESAQWVADQDTIEQWLMALCEIAADGPVPLNGQGPWREQPQALWESYVQWCGPVPHPNQPEFFRELNGRHGIVRAHDGRWFEGLRLQDPVRQWSGR